MRKFWSALHPRNPNNHVSHDAIITTLNSLEPILDLKNRALTDEHVIEILKTILSDKVVFKAAVFMSFASNAIGYHGVSAIAQLIESGKILPGSKIDLSDTLIGDQGLAILINALKSKKSPKRFYLRLIDCDISDKGTKDLLSSFSSGEFPEGICINLVSELISTEMQEKLILANTSLDPEKAKIQSDRQLCSYVSPSIRFTESCQAILRAVYNSSDAPLHIDLENLNLKDTEAHRIADIIINLKKPLIAKKFILDISNNAITEEGAVALAKALASGNLPDEADFNLSFNPLAGTKAVKGFEDAVRSDASPTFIKLQLHQSGLDYQHMQALRCVIEAKQIGFYFWELLQNRALTLPLDVVTLFMSYVALESSTLPIDVNTTLNIIDARQAYIAQQNQPLYAPALMRFGFSSANDMDRNKWLFLLTKEMSNYGVTNIQATHKGLVITFRDAQAKSDFIQMESQVLTMQPDTGRNPQALVIQDMALIAHILHEYARIDISLVFPEAGARRLEFKRD